jgi:hypothetical protein
MTFEEAWPQIREGKPFRAKHIKEQEWINSNLNQLKSFTLAEIEDFEFQMRAEPKEWTIQVGVPFTIPPENFLKVGQVIKLREVIE